MMLLGMVVIAKALTIKVWPGSSCCTGVALQPNWSCRPCLLVGEIKSLVQRIEEEKLVHSNSDDA